MSDNIFERGTRRKIRFFHDGVQSIEQLWQLHPETIDEMYKGIQSGYTDVPSLSGNSGMSEDDTLRCAILTHIYEALIAEEREVALELGKRRERQRILGLMQRRQDADDEGKSLEELEAMLNAL